MHNCVVLFRCLISHAVCNLIENLVTCSDVTNMNRTLYYGAQLLRYADIVVCSTHNPLFYKPTQCSDAFGHFEGDVQVKFIYYAFYLSSGLLLGLLNFMWVPGSLMHAALPSLL